MQTGAVPERSMAAISMAAISTAPTGMAAIIGMATTTGTMVVGIIIGEITTADGVGGTATGGAFHETTLCSLAVSASHGGGAGAGAPGLAGAGAAAGAGVAATVTTAVILTMAAAIPTMATAMAMEMDMATAMDMGPRCSTENTEAAVNPESQSCNGGCHAPATTTAPSTEFWGRKPALQSGHMNKNTVT